MTSDVFLSKKRENGKNRGLAVIKNKLKLEL
jgi:hypothetical protein